MRWTFDRIWDALSGLRDVLGTFTGWCSQMMSDWGTKYIIGPFAFKLFWGLYDTGWRIRWKVIDLRDGLESVGDFLTGIEDGWKLDDLIGELWSAWGSFTSDPGNYILDRVFPIGTNWYWFRQDPGYMLEFWLQEQWAWLGGLLYDMPSFIFDRMVDKWPDLYWFYQDPGYMLEFWLTERVPGLADFLFDMEGWLRDRIGDPGAEIREWVTSRMLHILQTVIENTWEVGEAD